MRLEKDLWKHFDASLVGMTLLRRELHPWGHWWREIPVTFSLRDSPSKPCFQGILLLSKPFQDACAIQLCHSVLKGVWLWLLSAAVQSSPLLQLKLLCLFDKCCVFFPSMVNAGFSAETSNPAHSAPRALA